MSSPLDHNVGSQPSADAPGSPAGGATPRTPCQEEIAGRARERTNAYGSTPPPVSKPDRLGYAARELERIAHHLNEQASELRERGEVGAAETLDQSARDLVALGQAVTASPAR